MSISVTLIFTLLVLTTSASDSPKLPEYFKLCRQSDPDADSCLRSAVQDAIPYLSEGVPELEMLPIDPLKLKEFRIEQGVGPVSITLTFTNIEMYGLSQLDIQSFKAFHEERRFEVEGSTPQLQLEADYVIDGKVLVLPITGTGRSNLTFSNLDASATLQGSSLTRDEQEYLEINAVDLNVTTTRLSMRYENLFNGDERLGEGMNNFLNENWEEIFKELKPAIEQAFGAVFQRLANGLFLKVPYNSIFVE